MEELLMTKAKLGEQSRAQLDRLLDEAFEAIVAGDSDLNGQTIPLIFELNKVMSNSQGADE